ncbi:MAG: hypothetical protein PUA86_02975 [Clostridiaceae bacterium]|nr:hypothetical protein [Clostridiaceae bacterium]
MQESAAPENRRTSPFHKLVTGNLALQVMVTILAAILYAVLANFMGDLAAGAITSAIFIPAYVSMIYTFYWGTAERERNMVLYGHMKEDKSRGLHSGLFSVIPLAIFTLVAIVLAYAGAGANVIGIYRICTAPFLLLVNPLLEYAPFALLVLLVFSPLASWWGYQNGYNLYRVWDHLIYKNGVKPRRGAKRETGPRKRKN